MFSTQPQFLSVGPIAKSNCSHTYRN